MLSSIRMHLTVVKLEIFIFVRIYVYVKATSQPVTLVIVAEPVAVTTLGTFDSIITPDCLRHARVEPRRINPLS